MTKTVLDVGQCGFDHPRIKQMIESSFGAKVDRAHSAKEAVELAARNQYDLITVNRLFDRDGDSGIELVKRLKNDPDTSETPVMLVSNYPDAQAEAVQAGAVPGFGKNAINAKETRTALAATLGG